jgi:hypothetical protein
VPLDHLYAENVFGRARVEQRIDQRRRRYAVPTSPARLLVKFDGHKLH